MAKTAVTQWDTVAANNTDINSISIQGTAPVSNFDNAMREMMGQIATFITGATFTGTTTLGVFVASSTATTLGTLTSTDATANPGPLLDLFRDSASPAANDFISTISFNGRNSAAAKVLYAGINTQILDPVAATEDARVYVTTTVAGASAARLFIGAGIYTSNATGGDKGIDTINCSGYYINGVAVPTSAQATAAQYLANTAGLVLTTDKVWSAAAEVTLTDAATIAVDFSTFINAVVTLGGNRAMGNPTNEKVGQSGVIRIVQDGTGSRTLSYGTDWEFAGGVAPVLSTAAAAQDLLFYHILATDRIYASLAKATA